jgi:hypothetical protein
MGVGSFFAKIAPWTAAAVNFVPGFGPVAAGAISAIADKNGIKAPASIQPTVEGISQVVASLTGNSQALADLKKQEEQYQLQLQQMGFAHIEELEQLQAADRASARQREIAVKDYTPRVFGGAVLAGFIAAVFMILGGHAKADSVIAGTLIGYLSAKAELVLTYYFGSSSGSDEKTKILADIAKS